MESRSDLKPKKDSSDWLAATGSSKSRTRSLENAAGASTSRFRNQQNETTAAKCQPAKVDWLNLFSASIVERLMFFAQNGLHFFRPNEAGHSNSQGRRFSGGPGIGQRE